MSYQTVIRDLIHWRESRWLSKLVHAGLLLWCIAFAAIAYSTSSRFAGIDFYQYWVVPQALEIIPEINLYAREGRVAANSVFREQAVQRGTTKQRAAALHRAGELRLSSTPFAYAVLSGFVSGNYDRDLALFRILALATSVCVLLHLLSELRAPLALSLLIPPGYFLLFDALSADLRVANVNQFQLGVVVVVVSLLRRDGSDMRHLLGGIVCSWLVLFKPNMAGLPLFLGAHWLARGSYRRVWVTSLGGLLGTFVGLIGSSYFFHRTVGWPEWNRWCWFDWFGIAGQLSQTGGGLYPVEMGNFSAAQMFRSIAEADALRVPAWTLCACLLLVCISSGWRSRNAANPETVHQEAIVCGLGTASFFYLSSLVWSHYFLLHLMLILTLALGTPRRGLPMTLKEYLPSVVLLLAPWVALRAAIVLGGSQGSALSLGLLFHLGLAMAVVLSVQQLLRSQTST